MSNIFEEGHFSKYCAEKRSMESARGVLAESTMFSSTTNVFISHKHSDLKNLESLIGFLEEEYDVKCYIDSKDSALPDVPSGITAKEIKHKICRCNKFILLATNAAIESKWCNWELGFGDAQKYESDDIAILPMKPKGTYDSQYKGNEYLELYPYIKFIEEYSGYPPRYRSGYYVIKENKPIFLRDWLKS